VTPVTVRGKAPVGPLVTEEHQMLFEHFALNVPDPRAMAKWYVKNCKMQVVRSLDKEPFTHFLADEGGRVVAEIYSNPKDPVPDYASTHPLRFHFAFAVKDIEDVKKRLIAAGARLEDASTLEDGSRVVMLRDPWGLPLQLCQRTKPMV